MTLKGNQSKYLLTVAVLVIAHLGVPCWDLALRRLESLVQLVDECSLLCWLRACKASVLACTHVCAADSEARPVGQVHFVGLARSE